MKITIVGLKDFINILKEDYNNLTKDKELEKFLKETMPKAFGEGFVPFEELPLMEEWISNCIYKLLYLKQKNKKNVRLNSNIEKLVKILKTVHTLVFYNKSFTDVNDAGVYESNGITYIPEFVLYHDIPQVYKLLIKANQEKIVDLLTDNYLSPYHFAEYYKKNFLPVLSKLNNKGNRFFFNLLSYVIIRENVGILSDYTYETLKEVGISDRIIAKETGFLKDFNGARNYVIANLKIGKEEISIRNIKVLEDKFIRLNADKLKISGVIDYVGNYERYYNELESNEAKMVYLYLLSKATRSSKILNFIAKHITELFLHSTNVDKKIASLLVKVTLKNNLFLLDKIVRFKKRKETFLNIVKIASPIKPDIVDMQYLRSFLKRVGTIDRTQLFSSLSKELLSILLNDPQLSEEDKKIIVKLLNTGNPKKKHKIVI